VSIFNVHFLQPTKSSRSCFAKWRTDGVTRPFPVCRGFIPIHWVLLVVSYYAHYSTKIITLSQTNYIHFVCNKYARINWWNDSSSPTVVFLSTLLFPSFAIRLASSHSISQSSYLLVRLLGLHVGSGDFGETIIGHGQTGNGPDANELSSTTEKKDSRSYANVVRRTKRFVRPEWDDSSHSIWLITANISRILLITIIAWVLSSEP